MDSTSREVCHCSPGTYGLQMAVEHSQMQSISTIACKGLFSCIHTQLGNEIQDHCEINKNMLSARRVSYLEAEFHLQVAAEYTLWVFFSPQESVSVIDCICVT